MTQPAYVTRETLARLLDINAPGYVDQLVKRGLLPEPVMIGEAPRWRWETVDKLLAGGAAATQPVKDESDDPYLAGVHRGQAAVARLSSHKPGR